MKIGRIKKMMKKKFQVVEVTKEMLNDKTNNILFNMMGGLLPENLSNEEINLLEVP
jgi:hypothetical protein